MSRWKHSATEANAATVLLVEGRSSEPPDAQSPCMDCEQVELEQVRRSWDGRPCLRGSQDGALPEMDSAQQPSWHDMSRLDLFRQSRPSRSNVTAGFPSFSTSTNPRDGRAAKRCGADDNYGKPIIPDESHHVAERIANRWLPHTE